MYKFRLSIGDWSGDGHCFHKNFTVASNMPVEFVREVHYKMKERTGIQIEGICSEYEDDKIESEMVQALSEMGFEFGDTIDTNDGAISPEEMARIWIFLLQKTEPTLRLEIVTDDIPTLHFCGVDNHGRHIGLVGYGLFSYN